ncbi:MAG: hypothetical protein A4E27_01407 [Methanobacterium sp. PtaU1.Bin242]|nr:MAG: hypothetical protein A4E27_01407 [Methanobacterium sp. PtaU1.Bin242]
MDLAGFLAGIDWNAFLLAFLNFVLSYFHIQLPG